MKIKNIFASTTRVPTARTVVLDNLYRQIKYRKSAFPRFSHALLHFKQPPDPSHNKRVSATAAHFGAASGSRPRELRPEARSAMRAQPNSAALKNASVFGAPELRQRAGVIRKPAQVLSIQYF